MPHLYENLNHPEGRWLRDLLILLLLLGPVFLAGLGNAPLIDPDEGRYAEIPREMLVSGDFITPTLNYVKYFEKPPLLYWVNAASMLLLGKNELAARLPSALAGLFTTLLVYMAGRRLYNRRTGLIAATILGTSAGFLIQSRIIITDMLLTMFLSLALFSFIMAARPGNSSQRTWYHLFFAGCAFAVLTKGLIGILIPGMILFWYLIFSRDWSLLNQIPWISGIILFMAISFPWFIAVSRENPEFLNFFFIHEHFNRFTSKVHGRYQPFWYFVPVIAAVLFPWCTSIPSSLISGWKRWRLNRERSDLFLVLWAVLPFLFFSLSSSKLAPYMLPVCPPIALLIASRFSFIIDEKPEKIKTITITTGCLLLISGVLFLLAFSLPVFQTQLVTLLPGGAFRFVTGYKPFLHLSLTSILGISLLLIGAFAVWLAFRAPRSIFVPLALIAASAIALTFGSRVIYEKSLAPAISSRSFAAEINRQLRDGDQIAAIGYDQGINFYTGRRVIVVFDKGELEFGSQQGDQTDWFMDPFRFMELWKSDGRFFCISDKAVLKHFPAIFTESQVLSRRGNKVLLLNRP